MFCVRIVLFVYILGHLRFSSSTITSKAASAPCTRLRDCPSINQLNRDSYGRKTLLLLLHCDVRNRQIYIKCLDPPTVKDFMERTNLIPTYDECGLEPIKIKISGGNVTDIDDSPWIALLRYKTKKGEIKYGCHGNLITNRYLLTAAHCVDPKLTVEKINANVSSVVLGEYDIKKDKDCVSHDCADDIQEIAVEKYHIHPNFNSEIFVNDIAIIRMVREVTYSDYIKPICMPPANIIVPYDEILFIAGWGNTEKNEMNSVKMEARFKLREKEHCMGVNLNMTGMQFCASSTHNAQTCPGDSGGPLMAKRRIDGTNHVFLIGVDSLGTTCLFNFNISIYTRVSPYIEWIVTTIHK